MPLVASDTQNISIDQEDNNAENIVVIERPGRETYGFFTEVNNVGIFGWLFFLSNEGAVGPVFRIVDERESFASEYEGGLVVFSTNRDDYDIIPHILYKPDGSSLELNSELWGSFEPQYIIGNSIEAGSLDAGFDPIVNSTSATLSSGRRVEVFTASDNRDGDEEDADDGGDGVDVGVFVQLYGVRGNKIGDPVRVNEKIAGDQDDPEITLLGGDKFLVTYADGDFEPVLFKGRVFESVSSLDTAIIADAGNDTLRGDRGDNQTDIFLYDTAKGSSLGRDRIRDFGGNDLLLTTSKINDSNGDDIITFGRNRRLDLADGDGEEVAELRIDGTRSLEYDGEVTSDGITYYVYSRVGSDAGLDDLTF